MNNYSPLADPEEKDNDFNILGLENRSKKTFHENCSKCFQFIKKSNLYSKIRPSSSIAEPDQDHEALISSHSQSNLLQKKSSLLDFHQLFDEACTNIHQKNLLKTKSLQSIKRTRFDPTKKVLFSTLVCCTDWTYTVEIMEAYNHFKKIEPELELHIQNCSEAEKVDICLRVALILSVSFKNDEALKWLKLIGEKSLKNKKNPKIYVVLNLLGYLEGKIKHLDQARKLIKQKCPNDIDSLAWNYNHRGICYSAQNNHQKALESHYKALELRKKIDDPRLLAFTNINISETLCDCNQPHQAQKYLEEAEENANKVCQISYLQGQIKIISAIIKYQQEEDIKKSEELYYEGLNILEKELPKGNSLVKKYQEKASLLFGKIF